MIRLVRLNAILLFLLTAQSITCWAAPQNASCPATSGRDFRGKDLTNHNFHADPPGSLVGANFSNAKLSGAIFSGQDLTGASFQGANLGPSKAPVDFTNAILKNTCFIGATLDKTDFSYAEITCADFSDTSLMEADFGPQQKIRDGQNCRTKFIRATLDVHLITEDFSGKSNWSRSDFSYANFQNLSPSTFSLAQKDITGAVLAGTNFSGIDMTGANLTAVDFTEARLTKANLDHAALNGAVLKKTKAAFANFACAQFYGTGGGQQKKPDGTQCSAPPPTTQPAAKADLTQATLNNTNFTAALLDHAILSGANLNRANLTQASLKQADLQSKSGVDTANVQFADFTRADLQDAQLASVDFSGGVLTGARFDHTTLNGTRFDNTTMPESSFQSAKLQSVSFSGAILESANFTGATMEVGTQGFAPNFQCAQLGGTNFKDADIKGAKFGAAVMPAAEDCCRQPTGAWCGNVDATQRTYGAVTFPVLNAPVTCPNGEVVKCIDSQWRLSPDWRTTSCSSEGSLQTMWSKPDCGGGGGDIVQFNDLNLKNCILKRLPGEKEVRVKTASEIRQVTCPNAGITDITGLEQFSSLTSLDLSGNKLTQFTLKFAPQVKSQLQSVDLSHNQLTTLDLRHHPRLMMLYVSDNKLKSISLNANTYLVVLVASHNEISSFDLAIQNSLAYGDLSFNKLAKVFDQPAPDLSQLKSLTYLDLSHNVIGTIGSIKDLSWNRQTGSGGPLQSLFLACNPSFECNTLQLYDGRVYPAAGTSMCSRYNPSEGRWVPVAQPDCPPGAKQPR